MSRARGSGWLGLGRPKYLEEKVKPAWFCQNHRRSMVQVFVLDPRGGTVGNGLSPSEREEPGGGNPARDMYHRESRGSPSKV